MIHKKILFSLFILFFLLLLITSSLFFNDVLTVSNTLVTAEDQYGNLQCYPIYPDTPTVVFRLDDIQANVYKNIRFLIIDEILKRNMAVVVGLIPKKIELDRELKNYLREQSRNSHFEIAQHGYLHTPEEFKNISEEESYEQIQEGFAKISQNIGLYPLTFIPPSNEYSKGTIESLKKMGFKIVSAKEDEYFFDGAIFFMGKTAETYDFFHKRFIPAAEVLEACEVGLELRNFCVIVIHPQDYLNDQSEIDEARYSEFLKLLNELEKKNLTFKAPHEMIYCKENLS